MSGLFILVLVFIVVTYSESRSSQGHHVRTLLDGLTREEWSDDEEHCKTATFRLLNAVENNTAWGTWVWDSMQSPFGVLSGSRLQLGSYDQCLEDPWSQQTMQYCLLDVQLTRSVRPYEEVEADRNVREFVELESKYGNRHLNHFSIGVCLPSECSPSSVIKISRHLHKMSHLPFGDVTVDPRNCQTKDTEVERTMEYYLFWCIIFLTVGVSTMAYFKGVIKQGNLCTVATWFDPLKNYESLIKKGNDEIVTLNCLRTFGMMLIISSHYVLFIVPIVGSNPLEVLKSVNKNPGTWLLQLPLVTDVFFLMSGLLHAVGVLKSAERVKMLIKRYIRLVVPYFLSVLFMRAVLPHTGSGPLWPRMMQEQVEPCKTNSLPGLLMANNFIRSEEMCHLVTWFISCDFQLCIVGTVFLCLCLKSQRKTVLVMCSTVFLVFSVIPPALAYWYQLPPILLYDMETATNLFNRTFQLSYQKPYSRMLSYLSGMALGYFMHRYKPNDFRKSISKSRSIILGTIAILVIWLDMYLGGYINNLPYNAGLVSAYNSVDRTFCLMGVALLIVVVEYGEFPLLGDFFTSKVFVPLSRLSSNAYFSHMSIIVANLYSTRTTVTYNYILLMINGLGFAVASYVVSYLLWFTVEAPLSNCINYLFKSRKDINPNIHNSNHQTGQKSKIK